MREGWSHCVEEREGRLARLGGQRAGWKELQRGSTQARLARARM